MSVFLFSGQGAQKVGMGRDLVDVPEVSSALEAAGAAVGVDALALVASDDADQINETLAAQALTVGLSVGVARALEARGRVMDAAVGFSLGQISALIATGALSDEEGFALLGVRARALAKAAAERDGAMCALLGASHDEAQEACEACAQGDVLVCANYNAPGQVVVSGDAAAVDRVEAHWKAAGKRASRLKTAGAFHSPLMAGAADEVRAFCEGLTFREPRVPVICNTDAAPFVASEAAERLARQIVSPVLFEQSVARLIAEGHTEFVEAGFGGVLFNLMKRIDRGVARERVGTRAQLDEAIAAGAAPQA